MQPDARMRRWLEGLPTKSRDKLAEWGLLDTARVGAAKPLSEHLADYKRALLDKGNTQKHADLVASRIEAILDGTKAKHPLPKKLQGTEVIKCVIR